MPAAQTQNHDLLWLGGAAALGLAGYEFLYKPWVAAQLAATTALSPLMPGSMISSPTLVGPSVNPQGVQGSIVDPRVSPGGDVGQAMWRKNWTQQQAADRLAAIKLGYSNSLAAISQLQSQVANPAAGGIAAAQLALQQSDAAAADAINQQQLALAKGDQAGAAMWAAAAAAHQQDSREIRGRIATASSPPDNSAGIAAYQGTIAGLKADYAALTGMTLQ